MLWECSQVQLILCTIQVVYDQLYFYAICFLRQRTEKRKVLRGLGSGSHIKVRLANTFNWLSLTKCHLHFNAGCQTFSPLDV
ncbi:hypothetical protein GDO86_011045 [Hymenochirus boettgeri]|uniref:Uncharacterized protein n=1 Tax=Hymenochirus boettgeri TaxID=247094 RepID=A0A8T2JEV2_9PIPI|nr:hypothetical protein GDO86_011045 [Hymenochirus boettgeri]